MLSTKVVSSIEDIKHIPETWIYEHFLNLSVKLTGQNITLSSVFTQEKTPSFFIYFKNNKYLFKDFSSGYGGDAIQLIMKLYSCTYLEALNLIYKTYSNSNINKTANQLNYKIKSKFKINNYEIREYNINDKTFWTKYNIGKKLLTKHDVYPLSFFELNNEEKVLTYRAPLIYGYFNNEGKLLRIYVPSINKGVKSKFFIINPFEIQGYNQLDYSCDYLIITSSMKDLLTIKSFNIKNLTGIAVLNETVKLNSGVMSSLFKKFKKIFILLDNDKAGIKSTQEYVLLYPNLVPLYLTLSKDISDSVVEYGVDFTKKELYKLIKSKL